MAQVEGLVRLHRLLQHPIVVMAVENARLGDHARVLDGRCEQLEFLADLRARLGDPETEKHLDALNASLLDNLQRGGDVFVSNAVIGGRYALRACIVNFHTAMADVEAVPDIVVRTGRAIDAGSRAQSR